MSILVTTSASSRILRWQLPAWSVWVLLSAAVALLVACALLAAALTGTRGTARRARALAQENDSLRAQSIRLDQLARTLTLLAHENAKMRALAGASAYDSVGEAPGQGRSDPGVGAHQWTPSPPHVRPHTGPVSRSFSDGLGDLEVHAGVDVAGRVGTPILAAGGALVIQAEYDSVYGNVVVLDHGEGIWTRYGHSAELLVAVGDSVFSGMEIARLGSTGRSSAPHVHFEVLEEGAPVDPGRYIPSLGWHKN